MNCDMRFCKRQAIWEAIPIERRKKDVTTHYYCDFHKKYTQEKNDEWQTFIKLDDV